MSAIDRARADSFGSAAELYDQVRPSYPPEMIEMLLAGDVARHEPAPRRILDVGCGTGKATLLLAGDGRHVLGLEPDPRMAAVARGHGLSVEIGRFETWDRAGRQFDLLSAAQSWHWVDPVVGARKAAAVLRDEGRFAAFWNQMRHSSEFLAACEGIYRRYAPQLLGTSVVLGSATTAGARIDSAAAGLAAAGFDVDSTRSSGFVRRVDYTPESWIRLLSTHSDHRTLEPPTRDALLDELRSALDQLGPSFTVVLHTDLLLGVRSEQG